MMDMILKQMNKTEVCEFYSNPRVVPKFTKDYNGIGKSFDIMTTDEFGNNWDFIKTHMIKSHLTH